jgi:hypothetical protein
VTCTGDGDVRSRRGDHGSWCGAGTAIGSVARAAGRGADVKAIVGEGLGKVHVGRRTFEEIVQDFISFERPLQVDGIGSR